MTDGTESTDSWAEVVALEERRRELRDRFGQLRDQLNATNRAIARAVALKAPAEELEDLRRRRRELDEAITDGFLADDFLLDEIRTRQNEGEK